MNEESKQGKQRGDKAIWRYADLEADGYGCRSTIWKLVKAGKLIPPRDFGNRPGWLREELEAFKKSRPQITYTNEHTAV